MGYDVNTKRVISLCGAGGSGKTTLIEEILFSTKQTTRKGSVEKGNTVSDFDTEEINRHISLQLSVTNTEWNKNQLYIIDTPGYHNFIADTLCGIRASDSSIIVIDAKDGAKAQTERAFDEIDKENKPAIFFINAVDKEELDINFVISSIKKNITDKAYLLQFPIIENGNLKGYSDILEKKTYDLSGNEMNLPADMSNALEKTYTELIEELSTLNDALMEKYLEGTDLNKDEINKVLHQATTEAKLYPILLGSALNGIGVNKLMDAVVNLLPPPKNESDKNSALVFKTYNDPQVGKLSLLRIYSGNFKSDSTYYNVNKNQDERLGALQLIQGKTLNKIEEASAGDVVAVAKLKTTETSDTISDKNSDIKYDFVEMPLPYISYAIYGESKNDEEKLGAAINKLIESDPSLSFTRNNQTKEFILTGMGKMHLEVVASKLKNKFGVKTKLEIPKIAYKETIKGKTNSHGRYKKQTGGHGQFGDCVIDIEPLSIGEDFEFVDKIVGGSIPRQFIPSVEKGIRAAMEHGILAGYQMTSIKVTLLDGSYHPVDSSDLAFQMAGSIAFKEGIGKCKPILIEPILSMEIYIPEENTGDVIGDINSKRGKVLGIENCDAKKEYKIIKTLVPEMEVLEYAPTLRSLTSGRGFFKSEFSSYEEVPSQIASKIIDKAKTENKPA